MNLNFKRIINTVYRLQAKLAVFADGMPEDELRCHILCLKHKTTGLVKDWQSSGQVFSSPNQNTPRPESKHTVWHEKSQTPNP